MKAAWRYNNADDIEATVTITMSLGKWRSLQEAIGTKYPAWEFANIISDVVRKASALITSEHQAEK